MAVLPGLLEALARVRDAGAGRNSLTAIAEWVQRCDQAILARLGCSFDRFTGRFTAPGERTLRNAFGKVDAAALTQSGFAHLAALPLAYAMDGKRLSIPVRTHGSGADGPTPT
ncbi:hypothetical protein [Streptomyces olivochromogenes]|uniref:hypothetical protein n=1 Tax=Streptomyces olivochromogenes TaxID=1963 RepID=UPI001F1F3436|nr:hypothetical protein [Streptomyces olivochromogenes]MCF3130215.1 hypothetical protein [Streptomyces olivochromogenes]